MSSPIISTNLEIISEIGHTQWMDLETLRGNTDKTTLYPSKIKPVDLSQAGSRVGRLDSERINFLTSVVLTPGK